MPLQLLPSGCAVDLEPVVPTQNASADQIPGLAWQQRGAALRVSFIACESIPDASDSERSSDAGYGPQCLRTIASEGGFLG